MTNRTPSDTAAVEVRGLRASYGSRTILDSLDLTIPTGSVLALLGPNGSGKTTTVRVISTLLRPDAGSVEVLGHDVAREPDAVRAALGVTGQFSAVDDLLTGRENLQLMADLRHLAGPVGRRRVAELLDRFDLAESADRPAGGYSGGMRRRLDLAMTLVGNPRVIVLDEPTTGLDPRSRRALWDIVGELVGDGVSILLTTQYLDEADALADHVALLDGGRLVAEGTPEELKRRVPGGHLQLELTGEPALEALAARHPEATRDPGTLTLRVPTDGGLRDVRRLLDELDDSDVSSFDLHTPDLDDVFLALTGHAAEKEAVR